MNTSDGSYTVTVFTFDGCIADATISVRNVSNLDIYAPNIINPGSNSGNNSFYLISKPGSVKVIKTLRIYDRWGNMVFLAKNIQPDDPTVGWRVHFSGYCKPLLYLYGWQILIS
ncbi:MAG: hypothetical protein IPN89_18440 [Saprospiraceae bacterium]|nr:hypothetical protein [Saprospiraceae bacterium]